MEIEKDKDFQNDLSLSVFLDHIHNKEIEIEKNKIFHLDSSGYCILFDYIENEEDVFPLTNDIVQCAMDEDAAIKNLLFVLFPACIWYLKMEQPRVVQNIASIDKMLRTELDVLDALFLSLERSCPDHMSIKQWNLFRKMNEDIKMRTIISAINALFLFRMQMEKKEEENLEVNYPDLRRMS